MIDWKELAFQIPMVIALVTLVKKLTKEKLGEYYMLIAMGFACIIVYISMADCFALIEFIKQSIVVGLSAAGVYNVANKIGTGN
jgi:Sec-independent protein secretion pathway component TatC